MPQRIFQLSNAPSGLLFVSVALSLVACSGSDNGASGSGGSGGANAGGAQSNTGGTRGSGGSIAARGTIAAGGTPGTGGAANTGGSTPSGGAANTGGSAATAGATSTGGSRATGGASGTGGSKTTGGTSSTGGSTATGGASSTGGATAGGASGAGPEQCAGRAAIDSTKWKLVWSDEFDKAGAPNSSSSGFEHGFVRNQELQWYQPDNATVSGGLLTIAAQKQQVLNPNYDASSSDWKLNRQYAQYTSSSLTSSGKQSFLYGRFEMCGTD